MLYRRMSKALLERLVLMGVSSTDSVEESSEEDLAKVERDLVVVSLKDVLEANRRNMRRCTASP